MGEPTWHDWWWTGKAYQKLVEESPEAKEALQFAANFQPKSNHDYGWIVDTALKESESVRAAIQIMDTKADSLIGHIGAAGGILALATAYVAHTSGIGFVIVAGPTLLFFLCAIGTALKVRLPGHQPGFPSARDAFKVVDHANGRAVFAAEVLARSRAARIVIGKKGDLTRRSYWQFFCGMAWFVLASIVFAFIQAIN